jgi:hypothetical protein
MADSVPPGPAKAPVVATVAVAPAVVAAPVAVAPAPVKSGFFTSEFALHLLAIVLGALLSSGILQTAPANVTQLVSTAVIILSSLGYTASRTAVKVSASTASATTTSGD